VAFEAGTAAYVRDRKLRTTDVVAVSRTGETAPARLSNRAISGSGRYVAFTSDAADLVAGDANERTDAFIRDRVEGTTSLVSVSSSGRPANQDTDGASISGSGRFVAFQSAADNLVGGDDNGAADVFLWNRITRTTRRVSIGSDELQADAGGSTPALSYLGRFVAFESESTNLVPDDTNGTSDIFLRDRFSGTTRRVSLADDGSQGNSAGGSIGSHGADLSADGRHVAFTSYASNLVPEDTNGAFDVFLRDRGAGTG
jgi:hypothetical protein